MTVVALDENGNPIKTEEDTSAPLNNDDIFAQAFSQISEADAKLNASEPGGAARATDLNVPGPTGGSGTPEPEPEPAMPPAEEDGLPPDDKAARAAQAAEAARIAAEAAKSAPASPPIGDDEIARRLAALVKNASPEAPRPQEPQPQEPALPPLFTKEDEDFLKSYDTEYPDISRAEMLRRRADLVQATRYIFSEISANLRPLVEQVQIMAARTHLGDIQQAVPDYAATREGVLQWVDQQPAYLKVAYQHVVKQGTPDEVADLIRRFKADTGAATPPAQQTPPASRAQAQPVQAPAIDPTVQRAAAKLAPVATKRASSSAQGTSKDDFDGAFSEFAKLLA